MNKLKAALPFLFGFGLFITAFITYLVTLCPSLYFGDSGELITAVTVLGVPHPTGFPLYILAGKLFSFLPLGSPAFRVNLLSAFSGALVPVMIFFGLRFYSKKESGNFLSLYLPLAAAALFIFSYTLWSQAVIARIYALNALFCAASLALFLYYTEACASKKALYLLALITGLGAGIHLSFITFTGILWLYLLIKRRKEITPLLIPLALFALAGASVYLYIYIRGSSTTPLKWHDLNSFNDLKDFLTQAQYKAKMFTRDPRGYAYFFNFIGSSIAREFSGAGLLLFLSGAAWAAFKNFRYFWPFCLIFVSNIFTLAVYGNYTDMPISFRYMIPSYVISVFFMYLFCSNLYSAIKNKKAAAAAAIACLALVFVFCFPKNNGENNRAGNYLAHNYAFDLLSAMPEKSYFFTSGDNQIYTMAYAKIVLKKFSGVTVYDQIDTIFRDVRGLWKEGKPASVPSNIITAFTENLTPIYTTSLPGNPAIGNSSAGLVYRLYDGPSGPDESYIWQLYSLKGILRDADIYHAFDEREVAASYYYRMAQHYKKQDRPGLYTALLEKAAAIGSDSAPSLGNIAIIWSNDLESPEAPKKADELFNRAMEIDPGNELLYFNAGSFYARVGAWEKAAEMFTKTSELNPLNIMARIYLSRVTQELENIRNKENQLKEQAVHYERAKELLEKKDYDRAIEEFNLDISLNPGLGRSYFHIGLIHSMRNELNKAIPFYEKAAESNQTDIAALNNLGLCYLMLKKKAMAKEVFSKSLKLNPDQERIKKLVEGL